MYRSKIYGAGSAGNHLAHACRKKGWEVVMVDSDQSALERTKNDIYPTRYGEWDDSIELRTDGVVSGESPFDLCIISTPPDTHLKIALDELSLDPPPQAFLIEKPLATPSLEDCDLLKRVAEEKGSEIYVGYNHTLTPNTLYAGELLQKEDFLGKVLTVRAAFIEHWGGIFAAHPWLAGPHDSYLGFSDRGGGASGEHSHAINIWQHFALKCGAGRVVEVLATLDRGSEPDTDYDKICQIHVKTETGLVGHIVQDVVTWPSKKYVSVQAENGFLSWHVNYSEGVDAVKFQSRKNSEENVETFQKSRPDDFQPEVDHIDELLQGKQNPKDSPIHVDRGLETMLVLAAVHKSAQLKKAVHIDYEKGWNCGSLVEAHGVSQ